MGESAFMYFLSCLSRYLVRWGEIAADFRYHNSYHETKHRGSLSASEVFYNLEQQFVNFAASVTNGLNMQYASPAYAFMVQTQFCLF